MLGLRLLNPDWGGGGGGGARRAGGAWGGGGAARRTGGGGGGAEEPEGWMKNSLNEETLSFGPNEQVPRGR